MNNQLVQIVQQSGLETQESQTLLEKFGNYEEVAREWEAKAKMIVVTSPTQTTEMSMAREARRKFSQMRLDLEKTRKAMKEQSLRKGQAIDSIARYLQSLIAPIELYLKEQEDFVEIQAKAKAEEARIAEEKRLEEERIKKEKADAEEREKMRIENERLKKESEEKEKKLAEEREKAEAEKKAIEEKARIEKEEVERKLRIERERKLKAQQELEAKRKRDRERAERQLREEQEAQQRQARKSEGAKFNSYIRDLMKVDHPELEDEELIKKVDNIINYLNDQKIDL